MDSVRQPAVAGTFYPNDPARLSVLIRACLAGEATDDACPKALIAPHAGYVYSGPVAGRAYRQLLPGRHRIKRVVLLGPSHRVAFRGMAVPGARAFGTPLGEIPIAGDAVKQIAGLPAVNFLDEAHAEEHSLEVHLPFLQEVLGDFDLVPIVAGDADREAVAEVLDRLWGGPETLIVVSSDLSHYQPYARAQKLDAATRDRILALDATLAGSDACGCALINGLLHALAARGLGIDVIDVRNSGDTAGDRDRVVGYGAFRVIEGTPEWSPSERRRLIQLAREAIHSRLAGAQDYRVELDRFPDRLKQERATFVTLNLHGQLRGCIGSMQAHRPLVLDLARNAEGAAFRDPRFPALTRAEYPSTEVHVSILSPPREITADSRASLIAQLRPGLDGLIIREGSREATYLPAVWAQLPDPETFVSELRRKAELPADGWQADTRVFTYTTEAFS